jgi:hypothetical protein
LPAIKYLRGIQTSKLLITHYTSTCCRVVNLTLKNLFQHHILEHSRHMLSHKLRANFHIHIK